MPSCQAQVDLFFRGRLGRAPAGVVFVPGRVVVADARAADGAGLVLLGLLRRGIAVAHGLRPDSRIGVIALDEKAKDLFPCGEAPSGGRRWSDLARASACFLADGGARRLPGLDLVVQGDLDRAGGEASSTALAMAYLRAWHVALGLHAGPRALAAAAVEVERQVDPACQVQAEALALAHGEADQLVLVDTARGRARAYSASAGMDPERWAASRASPRRVTPGQCAALQAALEDGVPGVVARLLDGAPRDVGSGPGGPPG